MDFSLTPEQEMLRDTASALFSREFPSSLVRDACYDPVTDGASVAAAAFDRHLRPWISMGDESVVDQCLFMEEAGAAITRAPFWSASALALPLLRAVNHPDADRLADGSLTATVALAGSTGEWIANRDLTKMLVTDFGLVDIVVFVDAGGNTREPEGGSDSADTDRSHTDSGDGSAGLGGEALVWVSPAADLEARVVENLDLARPLAEVTRPAMGDHQPRMITEADLHSVLERASVVLAAEMVGTARWLKEATIEYVSTREQFGRPVGSFQGLQWKLVDASLELEKAGAAVYYAAMCLDADDPDRHRATHVAKSAAGTTARRWAKDAMQAHGGIGYTWEHDLHLYLRRANAADRLLGDSAWHMEQLALDLFESGQQHV